MRWRAERGARRTGTPCGPAAAVLLLSLAVGCGSGDDPGEPTPSVSSDVLTGGGGPPDAVRTDGRFAEWEEAVVLFDDPVDAPEAAIELGQIRALDDPRSLHLSLDLGREVNAQSLPGALRILVDADDDESTGGSLHGTPGVDLVLTTSYMADPDASRGFGLSVRAFVDGEAGEAVDAYPLRVMVAPTFAASRFEMRISRHGSSDPPLPRLGPRIRLRLVYVEGGVAVEWTDATAYDFATRADPALARDVAAIEARLARPAGTVRVAQLNFSELSFTQPTLALARLLGACEPDVLLLDELPAGGDDARMEAFFGLAPFAALGRWEFVLGASGGRQRSAVATRLGGLEPAPAFADVDYPETTLAELRDGVPERFHAAIDAEGRRGISTVAAWVPVGGRDVLFVALDLQSAGWLDSAEDRLRVLQAATILDRARTAIGRRQPRDGETSRGLSALVGGDFNLVGSRTPLDVLSQLLSGGAGAAGGGAASTDSPLEPVDAERLGERTLTTWRSPGAPFAAGRLDYLLVPTRHFEVSNAFAFTTEDLPAPVLERLALEADLSLRLSDHLVLVADVRPR